MSIRLGVSRQVLSHASFADSSTANTPRASHPDRLYRRLFGLSCASRGLDRLSSCGGAHTSRRGIELEAPAKAAEGPQAMSGHGWGSGRAGVSMAVAVSGVQNR